MVFSKQAQQSLHRWQQALGLTAQDTAPLHSALASTLEGVHQQRHRMQYRENLDIYRQMLMEAMERQYPLQDDDRLILSDLQTLLHLQPEDAHAIEAQVVDQMGLTSSEPAAPDVTPDAPEGVSAMPPPLPQLASDAGEMPLHDPTPPSNGESAPFPPARPAGAGSANRPELSQNREQMARYLMEREGLDRAAQDALITQLRQLSETPEPSQGGNRPSAEAQPPGRRVPQPAVVPQPVVVPQPAVVEAAVVPEAEEPEKTAGTARRSRSLSGLVPLLFVLLVGLTILAVLWFMLSPDRRSSSNDGDSGNGDSSMVQDLMPFGVEKLQQGQYDAAIKEFNDIIRAQPRNAIAYMNRGVAYHRLGQLEPALQDFDRAIELDKNLAAAYSNRSYLYFDQQQFEQALTDANQAVALNPNLADAYINLANARQARNDLAGALQDYNQALKLKPSTEHQARVFNNRGNLYVAQNDLTRALQDYNQAIKLVSSYADAYRNRGLALLKQGDRDRAILDLRQALNLYQDQNNGAMTEQTLKELNQLQQGTDKVNV